MGSSVSRAPPHPAPSASKGWMHVRSTTAGAFVALDKPGANPVRGVVNTGASRMDVCCPI